ncbi:unnamed protein product [Camellia sinensis]
MHLLDLCRLMHLLDLCLIRFPSKGFGGAVSSQEGLKASCTSRKTKIKHYKALFWTAEESISEAVVEVEVVRFLNKACIIKNPEKDLNPNGTVLDPWTLCTVQQVEELKALIKVLPIWSAGIIIARGLGARAINEGLADQPDAVVNMSAMWLVPQYCLVGISEAFNAIGQIQFYYSQFPKSMSSIGIALFTLGMGVRNLLGSLIVSILAHATKRSGNVSWVSNNLNRGHYDYYYWILTCLSVANFFYFLLCGWAYGSEEQNVWDDDWEDKKDEDMVMSKDSPIVLSV